jgi:hypothetical protein
MCVLSTFKKAFDSVVRKALLHKLLKNGIGGKFFDLITNMYSNIMYSCKFGNSHSDPFIIYPSSLSFGSPDL